MIVNKYNNGGGGSSSGVTPQDVQAQIDTSLAPYWESGETKDYVDEAVSGISLEGFWTSAETQSAITQSVSGKADASSVSENTNAYVFPTWNEQGVITGIKQEVQMGQFNLNGNTLKHLIGSNNNTINIYAPTTTGNAGQIAALSNRYTAVWVTPATINGSAITAGGNVYAPVSAGNPGDILVSTGNGAPVWSAVTGSDMSEYYTSAQTEEAITSKGYVTSADVETQIISKNYITSADTVDFLDDEDGLVISSAINDLRGLIEVISAATPEVDLSGYYTSAQTEEAITSRNYVTSAQVETQIVAKNYITSGQVKDQIEAYNYVTSADVETQIEAKNYITSAYTADFLDDEDGLVISTALNNLDGKIEDVSDHLDEVERITASAYTELHDGILDLDDRVDDVETSLATKVSSSTVSTIWKGTQAQYDAITTKDPATFYIIVSSN